jgi:hypothetical protein
MAVELCQSCCLGIDRVHKLIEEGSAASPQSYAPVSAACRRRAHSILNKCFERNLQLYLTQCNTEIIHYSVKMKLGFLSSLLLSGFCAAATPNPGRVSVGFDLNHDHGTAAVSYPDGTLQEVARLEGSSEYRETMRKLSLWSSTHLAYAEKLT